MQRTPFVHTTVTTNSCVTCCATECEHHQAVELVQLPYNLTGPPSDRPSVIENKTISLYLFQFAAAQRRL